MYLIVYSLRSARAETKRKDTERYRSGHNEAVLKTVCPKGHMGSNPILSASASTLPVLLTALVQSGLNKMNMALAI